MSILRSLLGALALAPLLVAAASGCSSAIETSGSGSSSSTSSSSGGDGGASGSSSSTSSSSTTSSGGGDDCTQGVNMADPHLAGGLEQESTGAKVRIVWDLGTGAGADLPPSYFDTIAVEGADAAAVVSAVHTAPREITVNFADLAPILAKQSALSFALVFPDRRDFIACVHPGMPDRYLLDVIITFNKVGEIASSELKEHIQLGDF